MNLTRRTLAAAAVAITTLGPLATTTAYAASRAELAERGVAALHRLEATHPRSRVFARNAKAVLVFPSVLKAGFIFGGETGNGVLLVHGRPMGFYNTSAASWGLQAGGKQFSYALFLMNDQALKYLHQSGGWAIGGGGNIVVVNQGAAVGANSTTVSHDVYAFPFNAKGLMAGIDISGSKITQYHPS